MALTANQKTEFINAVRDAATRLMKAVTDQAALKRKYDGLDLGTVLVDGDFIGGNNSGITKSDFATAVSNFASIDTNIATNNYDDNLYKITN